LAHDPDWRQADDANNLREAATASHGRTHAGGGEQQADKTYAETHVKSDSLRALQRSAPAAHHTFKRATNFPPALAPSPPIRAQLHRARPQ